jgi:YesN/AraC family two-component response regulator
MISGYADLEYLKSAFKIDVVDYILKPVNVNELYSVLEKVIRNIEQEKKEQVNRDLIKEKYQESIKILRTKFLLDQVISFFQRFVAGVYVTPLLLFPNQLSRISILQLSLYLKTAIARSLLWKFSK